MKGVKFNDIHSYDDLGLILAPFTITPATPKLNFLEVPGRDGALDLTEAHGDVKFNNRVFTFTFTLAPGSYNTFDGKVKEISDALNGLRCKITLDRDPNYYWSGRLSVNKYLQDKAIGQIVVEATVDPYRLKHYKTTQTFGISPSGRTIYIDNLRKPVVPEITCYYDGHEITVFDSVESSVGRTYTLSGGTHKYPGIRFVEGSNKLYIKGSNADTITFTWQEGGL